MTVLCALGGPFILLLWKEGSVSAQEATWLVGFRGWSLAGLTLFPAGKWVPGASVAAVPFPQQHLWVPFILPVRGKTWRKYLEMSENFLPMTIAPRSVSLPRLASSK